eukprot:gene21466-26515_t
MFSTLHGLWMPSACGPCDTKAITVGALLDVDFGGAKFSSAEEQKQFANAFGSEQCRVRIFGLKSCELGPEGGKQFAGGMATNTSIVQLNVGKNELGPDGGKAFAKALETNKSLKSLDVARNDLDAETKAAIKAAWGDRDADKLKL